MQHQQKESKKTINEILQDKRGTQNFTDNRIRISKDFAFYGVTQTKSGQAEISLALKVIKANGEQLIVQYHELISPMHFNGADKIELSTSSLKITISGKNLGDLIDYLAEHRLVWVKEPDSDFIKVEEGEVEINKNGIEVEEK